MSGKLAQIIEDVKALAPEERQQLREAIDTLPRDKEDKTKERQFQELLLERGLITHIPPPITDPTPYQTWKPVPIQGKPLSETIIEERR